MTTRQKVQVGVLAVLGSASLCYGGYRWWLSTPPPMPETAEQAMAVLQDPRLKQLPERRQADYQNRAMELYRSLDDDKRRELRTEMREDPDARRAVGQAMRSQMTAKAREYAMANEADRIKILDESIAMMESRTRGNREGNQQRQRPEREGRGEGERPQLTEQQREERRVERQQNMQDRRAARMEQGDPQQQAYSREFFKALSQRREEKGLDPMPSRGGGRGGGGRGR